MLGGGAAIQAKLDEILRAVTTARREFVGIEHLTEVDIAEIKSVLEREVLELSGDRPDEPAPTVEELLQVCRDPDIDAPEKVRLLPRKRSVA
jgi:low affinity Fe/Cu permease